MLVLGIVYFVLLILWLAFGVVWEGNGWRGGVITFILFLILGFATFGNIFTK